MRVNLRKLFLIASVAAILWFIVSYMSTLESPKPLRKVNKVVMLEETLNILGERMEMQLKESNKLLDRVKLHLKKTENLAKERDAKEQIEAESKSNFYNYLYLTIVIIIDDWMRRPRCGFPVRPIWKNILF